MATSLDKKLQHVQRWLTTSLTAREVAAEAGVSKGTIYAWRKQLEQDPDTRPHILAWKAGREVASPPAPVGPAPSPGNRPAPAPVSLPGWVEESLRDLSPRERAFVLAYCGEHKFNGVASARAAGYEGSDNTLSVQGTYLLRKPKIAKALQALTDAWHMPAGEVLARLASHARTSMDDLAAVADDGSIRFDFARARERGALYAIRKLKIKSNTDLDGKTLWQEVQVELYDAQSALDKLARVHGLYSDSVVVSGVLNHLTADDTQRLREDAERVAREELAREVAQAKGEEGDAWKP